MISVLLQFVWFTSVAAYQVPRIDSEENLTDSEPGGPFLIPLRRETVPIRRQGKIVTYKTSYSGVIHLGVPAQEFRVVFDTGSGHVVVPAAGCQSEACLVHKSYNLLESETAVAIKSDGAPLKPDELADEVTIGFGTGEIKGQFAKDHVCLGQVTNETHKRRGCLEMHIVMAVEMSTNPFKSFVFDGILGLGLPMLSLTDEFSFFHLMSNSNQVEAPQFGVFLTEGEEGEESEIAIGGFNPERTLGALAWSPVVLADLGHWQVNIKAVRVGGETLDICKDGTCRGVVDTGTSHIGVPIQQESALADMLTRDAGDLLDCRLAEAPVLEFELENTVLTLHPENYMRRLPLREGVNVGSAVVSVDDNQSSPVIPHKTLEENITNVTRHCSPRLMPVNMPEPLGPNLWILGEPVLHRYYTVYNWGKLEVGFSLANSRRNTLAPGKGGKGSLPEDVGHLLMQKALPDDESDGQMLMQSDLEVEDEPAVFVQVTFRVRSGALC